MAGGPHRSAFAKSDEAPACVHEDPDLAEAWTYNQSLTTAETAAWCHSRLDKELAKIDEWWLSDTSVAAGKGKTAAGVGIGRGSPPHGTGGTKVASPRGARHYHGYSGQYDE